jgi:D-serine deaminase-like pyridoxal phosphate-dependent protein
VRTRARIARALAEAGLKPTVFNGGGTGTAAACASEAALTEVTIGSGFVDSHLFDHYRGLDLRPAAYFALAVVRRPAGRIVTCHGGGYVASGAAGRDRLPVPALPDGTKLLGLEGAGEVQTPVELPPGVDLALGDPVFFRHAKAGELAEHFAEYILVRGDRVAGRAPTYRGLGKCFLG